MDGALASQRTRELEDRRIAEEGVEPGRDDGAEHDGRAGHGAALPATAGSPTAA